MAHVEPTVTLAGMNVDLDQLRSRLHGEADDDALLTAESVAAAYARLSRKGVPLQELRAEAARDVARARKSIKNISHKMGHQSIAEHAFFNLDFNDVSRLIIELIEHHRLASYTERSQRYVKFTDDFLLPPEIKDAGLADEYQQLYRLMFDTYEELYRVLRPYFLNSEGDPDKLEKRRYVELENLAKEDARYAIGLATQTALGASFNGRALELLIRRLLSHSSWEARHLGEMIKQQVQPEAPSLVKYCDPCTYFKQLPQTVREIALHYIVPLADHAEPPRIESFSASDNPDDAVIAAMLYQGGVGPIDRCQFAVKSMSDEQKHRAFLELVRHREKHDNVSRHFELPRFEFGLVVSASLFAQLKRHRLCTQIVADYDTDLGVTVPPSLVENKLVDKLLAVVEPAEALHAKILDATDNPFTAAYALTNAHRRRVLVAINLREMYHLTKERMANFAQWDIRATATEMAAKVREVAPITGQLLMNKDDLEDELARLLSELEKN